KTDDDGYRLASISRVKRLQHASRSISTTILERRARYSKADSPHMENLGVRAPTRQPLINVSPNCC
ncbi:unnamed protein product, partial [Brassica napus]